MKEFNPKEIQIETAVAHGIIKRIQTTGSYRAYIGLDVHKENVEVSGQSPFGIV
jgi:hypothetical protein